eukprot:CAMPEP_0175955904 /NCGR_PEP_ID=MMETSP0108-20121206/32760_1 /TAXON_ID=195067 ORGANISM="Goniomonas pacifica, Strain CCMP1869" /NCGR_SAMPLE_ID=MMETSP0108 /ASSEMBLY_ACC=CAM_ASM_000204 /LENGTH=191 /DNA_ID=CAMNT_0017282817 /DNA_START=23 /DNA_END=598 /DNA_ORIENTATION=+
MQRPHAPPPRIPPELVQDFTMGGRAALDYEFHWDGWWPSATPTAKLYDAVSVDIWIGSAIKRHFMYYNKMDGFLYEALDAFGGLATRSVVVVGSNCPWYEGIALAAGAPNVTTLEYLRVVYQHPNIRTVQVGDGTPPGPFDVALSLSSLEHDGLGRYGDPINATADLTSMQELRKVIKPGGLLFLSVPVGR